MQLLIHAARQLFGNFGAALKIAGVLLLIQWGLVSYVGPGLTTNIMLVKGFASRWLGQNIWFVVISVPLIVYSIMTVISRHRFVLRNEPARIFAPELLRSVFWRYLGGVLKLVLALAVMLCVLLIIMVALVAFTRGLTSDLHWGVGVAFGLVIGAGFSWLFLRLSTFLPGLASGERETLLDAFILSRKLNGQIFVSVLILALINIAISYSIAAYVLPYSVALYPYVVLGWYWVYSMLQVSLLTTIYGHCVENRPLNPGRGAVAQ